MKSHSYFLIALLGLIHVVINEPSAPIISRNERVGQIKDAIAGY